MATTAPEAPAPAPATRAQRVIDDVEQALEQALDPRAQSNAEGVAQLVRAALDAHR